MKIKHILLIIYVLYFFSCSEKKASEVQKENSTTVKSIENEPASIHKLIDYPGDSSSFIGFVNDFYFEKDKEFYIELYFKKDIDMDEYDELSKMGDSIIYSDDENTRTRIPFQIAEQYFDLSGLEPLFIYNGKHELVTTAHLKRVEFLSQNISPCFIAVFESNKLKKGEFYYCMGNKEAHYNLHNFTLFKDEKLTKEIMDKVNVDREKAYECTHYKTTNYSISVLNYDSKAYLIEKVDSSLKIIYSSRDYEDIHKIIFTHTNVIDKPVLLLHQFQPDTDVEWNSLLVFDGSRYVEMNNQRLK